MAGHARGAGGIAGLGRGTDGKAGHSRGTGMTSRTQQRGTDGRVGRSRGAEERRTSAEAQVDMRAILQ
eukprot:scaffold19156_cov22-Tisochrysis_lutea.AAC.2